MPAMAAVPFSLKEGSHGSTTGAHGSTRAMVTKAIPHSSADVTGRRRYVTDLHVQPQGGRISDFAERNRRPSGMRSGASQFTSPAGAGALRVAGAAY